MLVHLQLTLVSLDALGGTEAFSRADVAQIGVAVTLASCKARTKDETVRDKRFETEN